MSQPRGALQSLGTDNSENFCPASRADEGFRCLVTAAVRVVPKCHLNEFGYPFSLKTGGEADILGISQPTCSESMAGEGPCELPQGGVQFALQKMTYNLTGGNHGFTSVGRRMEELDLDMYLSGYTTSAEYPSNRAHNRAGPPVE